MNNYYEEIAIRATDVEKTYNLFESNREKLYSIFFNSRRTKEKRAIKNMNFIIYRGESVAILGNNGSGKSTLMKMFSKSIIPTRGEIFVNGTVHAILELKSGFEAEFTGRENIYLKAGLLGVGKKQIDKKIHEIIQFAELKEYIDQPLRAYSTGMKSRLGFAINVTFVPDIMIVDEALSVGDKKFQKKCLNKIRELKRDYKITFILVTHSIEMAQQFCSRGFVLQDGNLIANNFIQDAVDLYKNL